MSATTGKLRVHTSPHAAIIQMLAQVLEGHGIRTEVRGAHLAGAVGDIPWVEAWAELWLLDDGDWKRAQPIVEDFIQQGSDPGPPWTCARCGEQVEGNFDICWNCGAPAPARSAGP